MNLASDCGICMPQPKDLAFAGLVEYRKALIAAAVTGKFDVRNIAHLKEVA